MEDDMSELQAKNEVEAEDFTDELSDESLDRAQVALCNCVMSSR
jgi:hypothetical protein